MILHKARDITHDGGALYRCADNQLTFEILLNDSLGIYLGSSSSKPATFPAIALYEGMARPQVSSGVKLGSNPWSHGQC